jgi:hypothetical protein
MKLVRGLGICDIPCVDSSGDVLKSYMLWYAMYNRCYNHAVHKRDKTYIGCRVSKAWRKFSIFNSWFNTNYVPGYHLDKDIIKPGNKIYGPKRCRFVPVALNALLTDHRNARGAYPQGVSFDKGRLVSKINIYGKAKILGRFSLEDVAVASSSYREAKANYIKQVAKKYKSSVSKDVYDALIWRANNGVF